MGGWTRFRSLLVPVFAAGILGCEPSRPDQVQPGFQVQEVLPDPGALRSNQAKVRVLELSHAELMLNGQNRWDWLADLTEEELTGTLDGGGREDLGELVDAAVSSNGEVIVLDKSNSTLQVFGPDGSWRQELGGSGEGPGEFEDPASVSIGLGDTLVVADRMALVHRFVRGPDSWTYLDRIRLAGVAPSDACISSGRLFVAGSRYTPAEGSSSWAYSPVGNVHEIGEDGEVKQSFSVSYVSENPLVAERLSLASLACDPTGGRIWAAYEVLGEIHAFSVDGTPLWIARVAGFQHRLLEDPNGAVIPDISSRLDLLRSVVFHPGNSIIFSVESVRNTEEGIQMDSLGMFFVLDGSSGRGLGATNGMPLLGGSNGAAVVGGNDPYPRFGLVRPSW